MKKKCTKCQKMITFEIGKTFYKTSSFCIKCHNASTKEWREKNRDKSKEYTRKYKESGKGKESNRKYREKNKEVLYEKAKLYRNNPKSRQQYRSWAKIWSQKFEGKYFLYKKGARQRNIEFSLSKDEFKEFWQKRCTYCDSQVKTIGLDRVDNNVGYIIENVVSCCEICNRMKRNLTRESFINHCILISKKNQ